MGEEIYTYSAKLWDNVEEDITVIIGQNSIECSPHMELFWDQHAEQTFCN